MVGTFLRHSVVVGISQTLRRWTEGTTYIRQSGHHVGHWPTSEYCFCPHYVCLSTLCVRGSQLWWASAFTGSLHVTVFYVGEWSSFRL